MTPPTEDKEAEALAKRLKLNNYTFTHIWNESWQRGTKNIIIMMAKKKRLWVSKWFPDYCIILKRWALLFIELKRQKKVLKSWKLWASPSVTSNEQLEWLKALNNIPNVQGEICYWATESIELINKIELWNK